MILSRVIGSIVATQKNPELVGTKILITEAIDLDGSGTGNSLLAIDIVDAGEGDVVLVNKEGGCARMLLDNDEVPIQAVVVGVVDGIDLMPETLEKLAIESPLGMNV